MALPPPTETFRSLTHANQLRNNRGVGQVQFLLDEETPLVDAAIIKTRTRPGLLGFRMLNPELMDCKHRTKVELEEAYNEMFQDCMHRCDHELVTVDASIAELRRLINLPDGEIPHNGPPIGQRNQGLREVIYLRPPVNLVLSTLLFFSLNGSFILSSSFVFQFEIFSECFSFPSLRIPLNTSTILILKWPTNQLAPLRMIEHKLYLEIAVHSELGGKLILICLR